MTAYREACEHLLEVRLDAVEPDTPVAELGVDSLFVAELLCRLDELGLALPPEELLVGLETVAEMSAWCDTFDRSPSYGGRVRRTRCETIASDLGSTS